MKLCDLKPKVFVGMSGGVDSSVAALLLKQKNYDVIGCFIKGWYPAGLPCNWKQERREAIKVCAKLDVPFITINAEKEYKREVVDYMIKEYKAGRTPNPDVMCNRHIKFGLFLKKALEMGADKIATGHYVKKSANSESVSNIRIRKFEEIRYSLMTARDLNKDQSYFLWTLTQKQLKYCLFPLGNLTKPEVRVIAKKFNLPTAEKKESMGVCFLGEFDIMDFLKRYIKPKKGDVFTVDKKFVGQHSGVEFYTIGQRHGFSPGGGVPYYVVAKDVKKNVLIVSDKSGESEFYKKEVEIEDVNWINGKPLGSKASKLLKARIRYRQSLQNCRITKPNKIIFTKPQRAVTSGQSLVLYDGREMLGGGIIK